MTTVFLFELIGYIASGLVVVSLAMSSIIRLRVLNLMGAFALALAGVLIWSAPIVLTNVIIAGLDVWHLRRELTTREFERSPNEKLPICMFPGSGGCPTPSTV